MKKIALAAAFMLLSAHVVISGEPMATMKYVTNQFNRVDSRIDKLPTFQDVTNAVKDISLPGGYLIVSNKAMTALQPGDLISKLSNDCEYVTSESVSGLTTGKRDKEDLVIYKKGPIFNTSSLVSDWPDKSPFSIVSGQTAIGTTRYFWILVDKDGGATISSESYDSLDTLMMENKATFGYGGKVYELEVSKLTYYTTIYSGNGTSISEYEVKQFGVLASENFASTEASQKASEAVNTAQGYTDGAVEAALATMEERAGEIADEKIAGKGFVTQSYVSSNYYDKVTVDDKISSATPTDYELVKSNALSAVQIEEDPKVYSWAKTPEKPSYEASEVGAYTTEEVDQKVKTLQDEIDAFKAFDVVMTNELPAVGKKGVIYLIPSDDPEKPNVRLQYMWIQNDGETTGKWVRVGDTQIDLSEYAKKATTLEGYGITNAYDKTTTDSRISSAALNASKYTASIRATSQLGRFKPSSSTGYIDIDIAGKTIQEALEYIASETLDPIAPTLPNIKSVTLTGAEGKEVGTTFNPTYSISVDSGSYQYGPNPTGSSFDLLITTDSFGNVKTNSASSTTGEFDEFTVDDTTDYKVSVKGHYTTGSKPKNNKGQEVTNETLRINAGWWDGRDSEFAADKKDSVSVTGYRQWFYYIGTDTKSIDSTFIWNSTQAGNAKNASSMPIVAIPAGTKRIMIALPAANQTLGYKKIVTSVIDIDGMGLDILNRFEVEDVLVSSKNPAKVGSMSYSVWVFDNPAGLSATRLSIVIGDTTESLSASNPIMAYRRSGIGEYQESNNLNNNLNRQSYGPLDVSQLFYAQEDFEYYRTKGRIREGVSDYWLEKVPYPYDGQMVTLVRAGTEIPITYILNRNSLGEFDGEEIASKVDVDKKLDRISTDEIVFQQIKQVGLTVSTSEVSRIGYSSKNASRVLIGEGQEVASDNSIYAVAVGPYATVNGPWQVAVGKGATVEGTSSIALGFNSYAKDGSVSIGYGATSRDIGSVVISGRNDELNNGGSHTGVVLQAVSHGFGTVNFNPYEGDKGFWLGDRSLYTYLKDVETAANNYTEQRILDVRPSVFVVASGKYTNSVQRIPLYYTGSKSESEISGAWMTNATFGIDTGYPIGTDIHLTGTFAGRMFSDETYHLVGGSGNTASCTVEIGGSTFKISFVSPTIPEDMLTDARRGIATVSNMTSSANTEMYSHTDIRILIDPENEIDATPLANHYQSVATSGGTYDALGKKLSTDGGTVNGTISLAKQGCIKDATGYYINGITEGEITYDGEFGVQKTSTNGLYSIGLGMSKSNENEYASACYSLNGISFVNKTQSGDTSESQLLFKTNDNGNVKSGIIALDADVNELGETVSGMQETVTSINGRLSSVETYGGKIKEPLRIYSSPSLTSAKLLKEYNGSSVLRFAPDSGITLGIDYASSDDYIKFGIDTNIVSTLGYVTNYEVTNLYAASKNLRVSGDGECDRRMPLYSFVSGGGEPFTESTIKTKTFEYGNLLKFAYDDGTRMLVYNNNILRYYPNKSVTTTFYYAICEDPYFTEDLILNKYQGTGTVIIRQSDFAKAWSYAGNYYGRYALYDELVSMDEAITEEFAKVRQEMTNTVQDVKMTKLYDALTPGLYARYLVSVISYGTTYSYIYEVREDRTVVYSSGTRYTGEMRSQEAGSEKENKFYMLKTTDNMYKFVMVLDGDSFETDKTAMPTSLFPMNVGETKTGTNLTITKLSQGTQGYGNYISGNLLIKSTDTEKVVDKVATTSYVHSVVAELSTRGKSTENKLDVFIDSPITYGSGGAKYFEFGDKGFSAEIVGWPDFASVYIYGTVQSNFVGNVRFNGFVLSEDGKIVPANSDTIPKGKQWHGSLRRRGGLFYVEFIGLCE